MKSTMQGAMAIDAVDVVRQASVGTADPTKGSTVIDSYGMEEKLRKQFKDDPETLSHAMDTLRSREASFKDTQSQSLDSNRATLAEQAIVKHVPMAKLMQTPEYNNLNADEKTKFKEQYDNHQYQELSRSNALEARADAKLNRADNALKRADEDEFRKQRRLGLDNYNAYVDLALNPKKLALMTDDQMKALPLTLGDDLTHQLIQQKKTLNSDAAINMATVDKDTFNSIARQMGFDPKSKSTVDIANIGELHQHVDTILRAAQIAQKSPLTQDDKINIMQNAIATKVTTGNWFTDRDLKPQAHQSVLGITKQNISQVRVPQPDQDAITAKLKAAGQPVTTDAIKRIYMKHTTGFDY